MASSCAQQNSIKSESLDPTNKIHQKYLGDWYVDLTLTLDYKKKSNTLNARSESIFEKPSYKESAHEKRCLILADGFYEPHHENGKAIPYFCFQPSKEYPEGDLFLFAGLYNELDDSSLTTTILTTEANNFFAEVHNKKKRMPLILDEITRIHIIESLKKQLNVNFTLDHKIFNITPGYFIKFNYIFEQNDLSLNDDYLKNLIILLNLYKKNKDVMFIDVILFLTDIYFANLRVNNRFSEDKIVEIKRFVLENINKFFLYNLNQNALLNAINNKIINE